MTDKKLSDYIEELDDEEVFAKFPSPLHGDYSLNRFNFTNIVRSFAQSINFQHGDNPEKIRPVCVVWYPYMAVVERGIYGYLDIGILQQFTIKEEAYHLKPSKDSKFQIATVSIDGTVRGEVVNVAHMVFRGWIKARERESYNVFDLASLPHTYQPMIEAGGDVLYCGWCGKEIHAGNEHRKAKLFYCPGTNCESKAQNFDKAFPQFLEKWREYNKLKENDPDEANRLKQKSRPYAHLFDVAPDVVSAAESEWKALKPKEEPTPNGKPPLSRSPVNHKLRFSRAEIIRMLWPVCPNCGKKIPDSQLSLVRRYCKNDKCKDEYNNKLKKRV